MYLIVAVGAAGQAGHSHRGNPIAPAHQLTFMHTQAGAVGIEGLEIITVINFHRLTVTPQPVGTGHLTIGRGKDLGTFRNGEIATIMMATTPVHWVRTKTEGRGHFTDAGRAPGRVSLLDLPAAPGLLRQIMQLALGRSQAVIERMESGLQ